MRQPKQQKQQQQQQMQQQQPQQQAQHQPQQQHVQELAYYLWLSEGKPDGQEERHWQMASKLAQEEASDVRKRSQDPSEAKGSAEPAQPDQT